MFEYHLKTQSRPARPRSSRRTAASGSSGGATTTAAAGGTHSHANRGTLDALGTDENGYLLMRQAAEDGGYTDDKAKVGIADTLVTPRRIWGQSFDGSGNVNGDIAINGRIYLYKAASDGDSIYFERTEHGVRLANAGLYSDSFIAAGGPAAGGAGSGGGAGFDRFDGPWSGYSEATHADYALSAALGYELHTGKADKSQLSGYVPTSRKIAGLALTGDITAASVKTALGLGSNAYTSTAIPTSYVKSASVSGNTLTLTPASGSAVTFTNSTYTLAGLMGSTAKGGTTQPVYWNGSAWANTSYTLGKSVPSNAVFTDTKDTAGAANLDNEKLYLVGAVSQTASSSTATNSKCYIGNDNCLYSNSAKVATTNDLATALGDIQTILDTILS